jgi:hypothetical protein
VRVLIADGQVVIAFLGKQREWRDEHGDRNASTSLLPLLQ